jgi:hypothetical protein
MLARVAQFQSIMESVHLLQQSDDNWRFLLARPRKELKKSERMIVQ